MKLKNIIAGFLLLAGFNLFSQSTENPVIPNYTPTSPNVGAINSVSHIPVGLFTGTPNVNIPLLDLKTSNYSLPISLSYSSNGIQIDKVSSFVGMDWNLNAGGVVSRMVKGKPDDGGNIQSPPPAGSSQAQFTNYYRSVSEGTIDSEHDLFLFSFNGYSGKFYINNGKPILVDPIGLRIEFDLLKPSNDPTPRFIITNEMGEKYFFGGSLKAIETTNMNRSSNCGWSYPEYIGETAWYLTKILTAKGEVIDLNYETFNTGLYTVSHYQSLTKVYTTYATGILGEKCSNNTLGDFPEPCLSNTNRTISYLTEIRNKSQKIVFNYVDYGEAYTSGTKKLNTITHFYNTNQKNKLEFGYQVFGSDLNFKSTYNSVSTIANTGNRIFLTSIKNWNSTNAESLNHRFEYNNPYMLPPRFSDSRDKYGYFNGQKNNVAFDLDIKNLRLDHYDVENIDHNKLDNLFNKSIYKGNKQANGAFGKYGLLNKIIYPTGGESILYYEPHTTYGTINSPVSPTRETLIVQTKNSDSDIFTDYKEVIFTPGTSQKIFITGNVDFNDSDSGCRDIKDGYPTHHIKSSAQVIDMSTNQAIGIYQTDLYGNDFTNGSNFNFEANNQFVQVEAGKSYKAYVKIIRNCLYASLSFNYIKETATITEGNIEVGGMRISKTALVTPGQIPVTKSYFYGNLEDLSKSTGKVEIPRPSLVFNLVIKEVQLGLEGDYQSGSSECQTVTLSSGSLLPLYYSNGSHISYTSVIESMGENLYQNGGIAHHFDYVQDQMPVRIMGSIFPGVTFTNGHNNGNEIETIYFSFTGNSIIKKKAIKRIFQFQDMVNSSSLNYAVRKSGELSARNSTLTTSLPFFDVITYKINSKRSFLSKEESFDFDEMGLNPVITSTENFYTNPKHLQLSRKQSTDSKGNQNNTQFFYPDDIVGTTFLNNGSLSAIQYAQINRIKKIKDNGEVGDHWIGIPIQTEFFTKNPANEILSKSANRIILRDFESVVLPELTMSSKSGSDLETRIIYKKYDTSGNPGEISMAKGTSTVYIWGYDKKYPIAKIENATYLEIASALGISVETLDTYSENNLLVLNQLRTSTALPKIMVTTYEFNPVVGVTSITDPKGDKVTYHYDLFNRLQYVKDKAGNILKEHRYNYKN